MFKQGDKVVCINTEVYNYMGYFSHNDDKLELHKIYTVEYVGGYDSIELIEIPFQEFYNKRFISLIEHRKDKLDKLKDKIRCLK